MIFGDYLSFINSSSVTSLSLSGVQWIRSRYHENTGRKYTLDGTAVHHRTPFLHMFTPTVWAIFIVNDQPNRFLTENPCGNMENMHKHATETVTRAHDWTRDSEAATLLPPVLLLPPLLLTCHIVSN